MEEPDFGKGVAQLLSLTREKVLYLLHINPWEWLQAKHGRS